MKAGFFCKCGFTTTAWLLFGIAAAPAFAGDPVELEYYLPEARVAFGSSYELEQCPSANSDLRIRVTTAIAPRYVAGDIVKLDASAGFLVKRAVTLGYFANGTLNTINAESTGQGGSVVAAALKAAAAIVVLNATPDDKLPPLRGSLVCLDHVARQVNEVGSTRARIAQLEALLAAGSGGASLATELDRARASFVQQRARLTLASQPVVNTPLSSVPATGVPAGFNLVGEKLVWRGELGAPDFTTWFGAFSGIPEALQRSGVAGADGFRLVVTGPTPAGDSPEPDAIRSLWFRVPASYTAEIRRKEAVFNCSLGTATCADAYGDWKGAQRKLAIMVPQAGAKKEIPYAGSGIFGNRSVAATFREDGSLAKVGYTSAGGADQLAGVIDASVAAATTLRDAEAAAIARELALETNRKALEDLLRAAAVSGVEEDAAPDDSEGGN
jgi:hypothetical protein